MEAKGPKKGPKRDRKESELKAASYLIVVQIHHHNSVDVVVHGLDARMQAHEVRGGGVHNVHQGIGQHGDVHVLPFDWVQQVAQGLRNDRQ